MTQDPRTRRETIVVLDYGSQYAQLIVRRVRECQVYCEMIAWDAPSEALDALQPRGIILSGGPNSVYDQGAPYLPRHVLERGAPILGICYGMQLMAQALGGRVESASAREYGLARIAVDNSETPLLARLAGGANVWMSHGDRIERLPPGFAVLAHSANSPIAAMADERRRLYGLQFHPEVVHTEYGREVLRAFCRDICGCAGDWTPGSFVDESVAAIREQVGDGHVICAISGGVDSTVVASLARRAVGDQLTAVFVDTGLLRRDEVEESMGLFHQHLGGSIVHVDARERFFAILAGVTDPEEKRVRIGREFIAVFEEQASRVGRVDFLAQGTLYPDVIESATSAKSAVKIKTHHNVGGLPDNMRLRLIEPLRLLFKDEVRQVGAALGLPEEMLYRQPFPGPGLAVRIIGQVTPERARVLQAADAIVCDEIWRAGLHREIWQFFAVLTLVRSVGVMGDGRTYAHMAVVRAVTSEDGMTADWARIPYDVLARISNRIVNEVPEINRVVYDISSKPPATIEWE
jgi:GMP synthase (glutamine-hydrolysing)